MKATLIVSIGLFAIGSILQLGVHAATVQTEAAQVAPSTDSAAVSGRSPRARHSHIEERIGIPYTAAPQKGASDASKDRRKHFHPRDGK